MRARQNRVICNLLNASLKDFYFHFGDDRDKVSELVRAPDTSRAVLVCSFASLSDGMTLVCMLRIACLQLRQKSLMLEPPVVVAPPSEHEYYEFEDGEAALQQDTWG